MIKRSRIFATLLLAFFMALMPVAANAQTLSCNNGAVSGGQLYDIGTPAGTSGACQYTGIDHIVSQVVCDYVSIMDDVLGKVYCSMQYAMVDILKIVLTIYIAIFGVQILLGHTQLNAKEILTRLIKISFVWLFATDAAWGIGFVFNFFVGVLSDGASWVINPGGGGGGPMPLYGYLDTFVSGMIFGPFMNANFKLIGFFVILMHVYPTLAIMAAYWFWETLCIVGRILVSFMLSISALAFLIVLSPIFLSFMLFQATFNFFENWLRYLICYSLQMVVVFGIAVMWVWVTSQFIGFFSDLADLVVPYEQLVAVGQMVNPENELGLCPAAFGENNMGPNANCQGGFAASDIIPPSRWFEQSDFLYYLLYHLITLLLLAIAFKIMMKHAPQLVNSIVSPGLVPPLLGGGWGTTGMLSNVTGRSHTHQVRHNNLSQNAGKAVQNMLQQFHDQMSDRRPPAQKNT